MRKAITDLHNATTEKVVVLPLPRQSIVEDVGGGFLRFEVEIHWQEGERTGAARARRC